MSDFKLPEDIDQVEEGEDDLLPPEAYQSYQGDSEDEEELTCEVEISPEFAASCAPKKPRPSPNPTPQYDWYMARVLQEIISTDLQCTSFLTQHGILISPESNLPCRYALPGMEHPMIFKKSKNAFYCYKYTQHLNNKLSWSVSLKSCSIFSHCHDLRTGIFIAYCFAMGYQTKMIVREARCLGQVAPKTVSYYQRRCRAAVQYHTKKEWEKRGKLGGSGGEVQGDEVHIGKRKYEKGRLQATVKDPETNEDIRHTWVFGVVDAKTKEMRLEMCPEGLRNRDTLIPMIKNFVAPESTIITDCWRACMCLQKYGFKHHQVNHSIEFVNSQGKHTQRIEAIWRCLKIESRQGGKEFRKHLPMHLAVYWWRYDLRKSGKDPFSSLLDIFKDL